MKELDLNAVHDLNPCYKNILYAEERWENVWPGKE